MNMLLLSSLMIGAYGSSSREYVLKRKHITKVLVGEKHRQERFLYCDPINKELLMIKFKGNKLKKPSINQEFTVIPGGLPALRKISTIMDPYSFGIGAISEGPFQIRDIKGERFQATWKTTGLGTEIENAKRFLVQWLLTFICPELGGVMDDDTKKVLQRSYIDMIQNYMKKVVAVDALYDDHMRKVTQAQDVYQQVLIDYENAKAILEHQWFIPGDVKTPLCEYLKLKPATLYDHVRGLRAYVKTKGFTIRNLRPMLNLVCTGKGYSFQRYD